jgi:hypothetical protein
VIVKIASVFCDIRGPLCEGWIGQTKGATAARREAKEAGWTREDGQDICPACQKSP